MRTTVLAGGVGAARFVAGLVRHVPPSEVTVICNVGDDFRWHGLYVSPDIDTVIYTLAGLEGELSWGLRDDSSTALDELRALGEEPWFSIGDRDMATHLLRTRLLAEGRTLSEATAALARRRGLDATIVPVTDDPHPTRVQTPEGELDFQVYFVQRRAADTVTGLRFPGAPSARPAPGVIEAIEGADVLFIAPSNPFVSIGPMLAVPGVRDAVERTRARRVAVSPIVGGQAIKGPAADMARSLGHEASALGVARIYEGLIDLFVLDVIDEQLVRAVQALGMQAVAVDTMMVDGDARTRVAGDVLEAARRDP
jgi:LPPG:FO 2-phospho-L-lactate transferase